MLNLPNITCSSLTSVLSNITQTMHQRDGRLQCEKGNFMVGQTATTAVLKDKFKKKSSETQINKSQTICV